MHLPLISSLTELWPLLDVSAVAGHGAVPAALLFLIQVTSHEMFSLYIVNDIQDDFQYPCKFRKV